MFKVVQALTPNELHMKINDAATEGFTIVVGMTAHAIGPVNGVEVFAYTVILKRQ